MELWASPYELRSTTATRAGSLLKIVTEKGIGYADLHPWTIFGDAPLDQQLANLREGHTTALSRRSLELARIDLEFRAAKRSAFQGLEIPESHFLVTDVLSLAPDTLDSVRDRGFQALKLKLGRQLAAEVSKLNELSQALVGFRLRLDFNGSLSPGDFVEFSRELPRPLREQIEFVEDPIPWQAAAWREAHLQTGLPLALDFVTEEQVKETALAAFQFVILKPAVQEPEAIVELAKIHDAKLAVTSYMDHPLGQVGAAFEAARLRASGAAVETCGLLSHLVLEPTDWTQALKVAGPQLLAPEGFGFGFDVLLEKENWKRLR